jgi:imidazolonepropionase
MVISSSAKPRWFYTVVVGPGAYNVDAAAKPVPQMIADTLIHNVHVAGCDPAAHGSSGMLQGVAVALTGGRISHVGSREEAPEAVEYFDGNGAWLTPGLIDCHTHLVYGGNRAAEFAERLRGVPYEAIARRGGGILSTVSATRAATEQALFESGMSRLESLAAEGVTTVEIKSGYGLDLETELKMLRVARRLGDESRLHVVTTLLAAHALPAEFAGRGDAYIERVCNDILPEAAAAGLVDAVDVFCEGIGFSVAQCRRVFEVARQLGLPVRGHVEQLSRTGGAALVADFAGLSADHVEYLEESDADALSRAGTVAVLLPGAFYTLGESRRPPVDLLRHKGVPMAVATDLNPGSSPIASLLLNMNMACVLFGLTAEETLLGVTVHAAAALGLAERKGRVAAGLDADLVMWAVEDPAELSYGFGLVRPAAIWRGGQRVV